MTHDELDKILDEMYNMFSKLPNPETEPRQFHHYVKMYQHIKRLTNSPVSV